MIANKSIILIIKYEAISLFKLITGDELLNFVNNEHFKNFKRNKN
nr:hypothetical protein [Mycoplasmopsis bovis]